MTPSTERGRLLLTALALLAAARVAGRSMDGADDKALMDTFLSEVREKAGVGWPAVTQRPSMR